MDYNKFLKAIGGKRRLIFLSSEVKETYRGYPIRLVFDAYYKTITLKLPYSGYLTGCISKREEDHDYIWEADPDARLRELDEKSKESLKKLFILGTQSIEIRPPYLRFMISVEKIIKNNNYEKFKEICDTAIEFLKIFQRHAPPIITKKNFFTYHLIYILPIMLMVAELFLALHLRILAHSDFPTLTFLSNLLLGLYGLFLILPYSIWARKVLKNYGLFRISRYKLLVISIVWFLISFPFFSAINGYFDNDPPYRKEFLIVGKKLSRGRLLSQASFLIVLEDGKKMFCQIFDLMCYINQKRLTLPRREYEKVVPGKSRVELELKRGFLGIEWYRNYTLKL